MRKLFQQAILSAVSLALIFVASNANAEETWVIDSAHTSIAFKVSAVGYSLIKGTFAKFDGQMMVNFETPSRSRVEFNVAANSVKTGSASLDSFIISPVMFDAEKFPEMRFVSTAVERTGARTVKVDGNLTFHGKTKPVTFQVDVDEQKPSSHGGKKTLGFVAGSTIQRSEFNLLFGQPIISDDVSVTISTEAFASTP